MIMQPAVSFQFLIVVECVFCVVSTPGTPGENTRSLGLGPPGAVRDKYVVVSAQGRHERAAATIASNSSGSIVTLNMIFIDCFFF